MLHTKLSAGNRTTALGLSVLALVFGMALAACDSGGGGGGSSSNSGGDPAYKVEVTATPSIWIDGLQSTIALSAKLVDGTGDVEPNANNWQWLAEKGLTVNSQQLTIPAEVSYSDITVTAKITYNSAPYSGTVKITKKTQQEVTNAINTVKDTATSAEATAATFFEALKALPGITGLQEGDDYKTAYFNVRTTIYSYLNNSNRTDTNKISDTNNLIASTNFQVKTAALLEQFNAAADAAAIKALLTQDNFRALGLLNNNYADWRYYNALSDTYKTAVATALFSSKQTGWTTVQTLINAIQNAVQTQVSAAQTALVSAFSNKPKAEITPLLTEGNFTLLGLQSYYSGYNKLSAAGKDFVAEALANKDYTGQNNYYLISSDISNAIQNAQYIDKAPQIKTQIDVLLGANPTTTQINNAIKDLYTALGYNASEAEQLNDAAATLFKQYAAQAKTDENYFGGQENAIKAYADAGSNPGNTIILEAFYQVFSLISRAQNNVPLTPPSSGITALTAGTWKSDSANYGDAKWYSFAVTSGTTYYFWIDDARNGNDKTAYVEPRAQFGTQSVISGGQGYIYDGDSYTATSNGTVYLIARIYGDGGESNLTYAVAYSTSNSRPN